DGLLPLVAVLVALELGRHGQDAVGELYSREGAPAVALRAGGPVVDEDHKAAQGVELQVLVAVVLAFLRDGRHVSALLVVVGSVLGRRRPPFSVRRRSPSPVWHRQPAGDGTGRVRLHATAVALARRRSSSGPGAGF